MSELSVGRIVHYTIDIGDGPMCVPALVAELSDDGPALWCFEPVIGGPVLRWRVPEQEAQAVQGGTWHWPERTP